MSLHQLPPFRLERWFAEFEFIPGMRNLAASGPFAVTTRELLALEGPETTARYLELGLDYIENPGSESLRRAVASLYTTLDAENIRIMSGASEALFLMILTMGTPGSNIIIEEPCYENVPGIAQAQGMEVRRLPLQQEDGWKPDLEQLAGLIDENTRIIYLVHPHNPTGSALSKNEMLAIAELANRAGAILVNDEVFRLISLNGDPMPSIVDVVENAVSLGDMTKPWGLGGLRVGWVASRQRELLNRLSAARDYSTMCCSAPGEFLAGLALRHSAQIIAPRLAAARANLDQLAGAIRHSEGALSWQRPAAGYTAFVQLPAQLSSSEFCRRLAQKQHLLLLPGDVYGSTYQQFIRIGFGCTAETFQEGLATLINALQAESY